MCASRAENPQDPLGILGTVVAEKYQIVSLAGEGGFSLVYQARHLIWQQLVAIKFFVLLEDADPKLRERLLDDFIREGKLMSDLSSRSAAIVQARDIGKLQRDGGWIPYMVLEWLEGCPLDAMLNAERRDQRAPRSLAAALHLLDPIATALDLAHRRNVAHRDLKPANIMVMGNEAESGAGCKLLDFGIAKVMGEQIEHQQQLQMTGQQITAFTPNYGAPEQFSRQYGATGPWTDVFAMALIVIEVLRGGLRALEGQTFFELGVASSHPVRPTPRTFGFEVTDEVEAVFARALAIAPAERFATMGEFWSTLHAAVAPGSEGWQPRSFTFSETSPPASRLASLLPSLGTSSIPAHLRPGGVTTPPALALQTNPVVGSTPDPSTGGFASKVVLAFAAIGVFSAGVYFGTRGDRGSATQATTAPSVSVTAGVSPSTGATTTTSAAASANVALAYDGPCPRGMKPVNGGTFSMGSDDPSFPLWKPAHKVTLDTFCLDVHEVTAASFAACVKAGACKEPGTKTSFPKADGQSDAEHAKMLEATSEFCNFNAPGRDDHPINCVDWYGADAYCTSKGFRLPTEAEWELAARGTDGRKYPWGDDSGNHAYMNAAGTEWRAWHAAKGLPLPAGLMYEKDDGFVGTAPVGRFPRAQTQSGQLDMIGNVWEWTRDWYALYSSEAQTNPKGPGAGDRKAIRGGGFNGEFATWVNPAARYHQLATAKVHAVGFRCAAAVKPAP
ncbi:MAG: SUMF1/EgtB/PvdO family nonheme iron enzyme [Deltaproteobacteria bacterium]|nr:SUMF1/EgtB/PvdO family nonheme iron enzyme [Deltaproteobacteria bacterium]